MKLVADANILFSALLREGLTGRIWFHAAIQLYAPAYLMKELLKHRQFLRKKYKGSDEEFERRISRLLAQILFIDDENLKPYLPAASFLSKDPNDWLYLACALSEGAAIWSHDKDFGGQRRVRIVGTTELGEELDML